MDIQQIQEKWEELQKALTHKNSIATTTLSTPKVLETTPHPDDLEATKYGTKHIPGASKDPNMGNDKLHLGYQTKGGKGFVVRHGSAAQRTDMEHQMSKLLGADHMLPDQSYDHGLNHPEHHNKDTFNPHQHGGTSLQEHVPGKTLSEAMEDPKATDKLREQWKNGDLHKLWALHYISNNADMHTGNFNVGKDGVKAFDSDHAFPELPTAHSVHQNAETGENHLNYHSYSQSMLPSYLSPFVQNTKAMQDDGIPLSHSDDQVSVKALNEHAKNIQPDLFEHFGPHAAERAAKAKKALSSANPTEEMQKLWHDHSNLTGDLQWKTKMKQAA